MTGVTSKGQSHFPNPFMKKASFIFILFGCILFDTAAQTGTSEAPKTKPQFKLGVYYNSNLNYYGRTDSLRSSGFFPVAEFWPAKNFYITAAPVFVRNNATSFDYAGSVLTAGTRFGKEDVYTGNIYFVVPVYEDNSQLVQSALKAQGVASYTWLSKVLNVTASCDVKLSDKLEYGVSGGLDHLFRIELKNNSVLVIDPSAYINAGTQQFVQRSYKRSGYLFFPPVEVTEQVNRFSILSYEFSVPVVFGHGKLQLIANPAYVIPQNLIKVEGRPDLSERGQPLFYATIGAKMSF
jgi:hypothetical protein